MVGSYPKGTNVINMKNYQNLILENKESDYDDSGRISFHYDLIKDYEHYVTPLGEIVEIYNDLHSCSKKLFEDADTRLIISLDAEKVFPEDYNLVDFEIKNFQPKLQSLTPPDFVLFTKNKIAQNDADLNFFFKKRILNEFNLEILLIAYKDRTYNELVAYLDISNK